MNYFLSSVKLEIKWKGKISLTELFPAPDAPITL